MTHTTTAAIFLDRDGVINRNRADYVKCWEEFEFLPGTLQALQYLSRLDMPIVVVSNQSVIGRGIVARETVDDIHKRMKKAIEVAGGRIDVVLYCPHRPDDNCECRKPKPGLLNNAARILNIDLARSVLVGDALSDIDAARAVGCQPILLKTGRGRDQAALGGVSYMKGVSIAEDLHDVAAQFLHAVGECRDARSELRQGDALTPYHIMVALKA